MKSTAHTSELANVFAVCLCMCLPSPPVSSYFSSSPKSQSFFSALFICISRCCCQFAYWWAHLECPVKEKAPSHSHSTLNSILPWIPHSLLPLLYFLRLHLHCKPVLASWSPASSPCSPAVMCRKSWCPSGHHCPEVSKMPFSPFSKESRLLDCLSLFSQPFQQFPSFICRVCPIYLVRCFQQLLTWPLPPPSSSSFSFIHSFIHS